METKGSQKMTNKQINMRFASGGAKVFSFFEFRWIEEFLRHFWSPSYTGTQRKDEGEEKRTNVR